jgi:hypothetical protein
VDNEENTPCCEMHTKVALGIAKIYSEEECGVNDSVLVDYHNFDYVSNSKLPVAAALRTKFCPWCGATRKAGDKRRITEVIKPYRRD